MKEVDNQILGWYIQALVKHWGAFEPNLIDVIAQGRGWLPLEVGEKMMVHFDNKEYVICRTNDSNRQREPQAEGRET